MKNKSTKLLVFKEHVRVILILTLIIVGCGDLCFVSAQDKTAEAKAEETLPEPCLYPPFIVDEFGAINDEDEIARFDGFANQIRPDTDITGFVVYYGGRINKYEEFEERTKRIKFYLSVVNELDMSRIKFVHGGFRENFQFELWLSHSKGSYPPLSPTLKPEEVKYRGKMKPIPYCCL